MIQARKYIDLRTDFAFKKIFSSQKELLIALLNEIFKGRKVIIDISFIPTIYEGEQEKERIAIFDLICKGQNGEIFLIEMQRSKQEYFIKRALFYMSRHISQTAPRGNPNWQFEIDEIYLIAFLEKNIKETTPNKYLTELCLCDRQTGEINHEGFGIIYLELAKFTKTETELETDLDKWVYALNNMSRLNKIPETMDNPIFQKLFEAAEYTSLTEEEHYLYEALLKKKLDSEAEASYKRMKEEEFEARKKKEQEELAKKQEELAKIKEDIAKKEEELARREEVLAKKIAEINGTH